MLLSLQAPSAEAASVILEDEQQKVLLGDAAAADPAAKDCIEALVRAWKSAVRSENYQEVARQKYHLGYPTLTLHIEKASEANSYIVKDLDALRASRERGEEFRCAEYDLVPYIDIFSRDVDGFRRHGSYPVTRNSPIYFFQGLSKIVEPVVLGHDNLRPPRP